MLNFIRKLSKSQKLTEKPQTSTGIPAKIAREVNKRLKPHGFVRQGSTFRKEVNGIVHIITIWADQYNDFEEGEFYIDLGVYDKEVYEISDIYPAPDSPKAVHAQLRNRIEDPALKPPFRTWHYTKDVDPSELAARMAHTIEVEALPYFNATQNRSELLTNLMDPKINNWFTGVDGSAVDIAILYGLTGDKAAAKKKLDAIIAGSKTFQQASSNWPPVSAQVSAHKRYLHISKKLGIELDLPPLPKKKK